MCSKGTYVRSLARDLGAALGVGAHLTRLVRTRIGDYRLADAWTIAQIEALRLPRPEAAANASADGAAPTPRRPRERRPAAPRAGLAYYAAQQAETAAPTPPAAADAEAAPSSASAQSPKSASICDFMVIITDPADFPRLANAVVTSGTFDGVHLGHQRILARLRQVADAVGGSAVVITYWPHPRLVLGPPPSHPELLELQLAQYPG
ncbi:MAG: hypothetical protein WKG07_09790 [Hymenobacter sp.]